jgi:hypothetical protein
MLEIVDTFSYQKADSESWKHSAAITGLAYRAEDR